MMSLLALTACGGMTEITAEDEAAAARSVAELPDPGSGGASATSAGALTAADLSYDHKVQDCRAVGDTVAGRACQPREMRQAQVGPDTSAFFESGRQQQAASAAQVENLNRQTAIRNDPSSARLGERNSLEYSRIQQENTAGRRAQNRLRTAPWSKTVGSVQSPF